MMSTVAQAAEPRDLSERARPDLSVIVVTHNRAELAITTLRSARAAAGDLRVQWIVIDSGSSDGTPEAIQAAFADVVIQREENIGFAAANNRGLPLASGRYVLLLNPDVEIERGTFAQLVARLDERTDIGLASVVQKAPDGRLQYSIRRFPSPWLAFGEAIAAASWTPFRGWREEESRPAIYEAESVVDWVVGAFLIVRAEALAQVGGMDERFFLYSEEIDWCYRFSQAGWTVAHLPAMAITHHVGYAPRPDLCAQLSYAKILFAEKHYGKTNTLVIRAELALRHCIRASVGSAIGRLKPAWAARAKAERHALRVVLGLSEPPFEST
jgi:GT2 family glycosyltransferase